FCVALRKGNGMFNAKDWEIKNTDPATLYSLLFIIDSEAFGNAKKTLTITLSYDLIKGRLETYNLPFQFINYDNLTPPDRIPAEGVFPEIKIDTTRKPASEPENHPER
ncbi:MAG: hypothetical protein PHV59_00625, partial [Victivallales bacterium]|nr:hypothetical protein [Victivallales bacterium]